MAGLSARAEAVTRRTYNRPLDADGTVFEDWPETIERAQVQHQRRLWTDAGGTVEEEEIDELRQLGLNRQACVSGRTLWLGGTPYAYERAASQFNCSATIVRSVYDVVDFFWLLLNGCGVGGKPSVGVLHGYTKPIPVLSIIPSTRDKDFRGIPENIETFDGEDWIIRIGDSAEAWAKAVGKLINPRARHAKRLTLDFSNVRGPGGRLKGYGWICNGYKPLALAFAAIHSVLNSKAGELLDEIDIMDICNLLGMVLSSRRAAQIMVMDSYNPRAAEFAQAKVKYWEHAPHRRQSNNSFLCWSKPSRKFFDEILLSAYEGGDPGIFNASAALAKCPWFELPNPCAEILLGGFCNLVTNNVPAFQRNFAALERSVHLMARANYRQTCVDLNDAVLQPTWHQQNEALRLCGVSLTGLCQADWLTDYQIRRLRNAAICGAYSMADELGLPRPKAVTTGKPEGTFSKICGRVTSDVSEGLHRPLGECILNWINFSIHDPLLHALEAAGYQTLLNPNDENNMLVCFPVQYKGVKFDKVDGRLVNLESAVSQLDRYLRWNTLWADYNMSCTVSFDKEEIPEIVNWLDTHWERGYIATSFLRRNDPRLTAKDLGHPYLPQEVVTREAFSEYSERLKPVDWSAFHKGIFDLDAEECAGGMCPVR